MFNDFKQSLLAKYKKHETMLEVIFFIGGFIFDVMLVSEIDDIFCLVQQGIYLLIIAVILHYEVLFRLHKWRPAPGFSIKFWNYRNLLLHFLLGTLLNIYSLFYIKSASLLSSIVFLLLMIAIIIGNELPLIKKAKVSAKVGLYGICLFSYVSLMYPLLLGFVGLIPFTLALVTTIFFFYIQGRALRKNLPDGETTFQVIVFPAASVIILFSVFYVLGWIPPVPLSLKFQGIYHMVEKREGKYFLSKQDTAWDFLSWGDRHFKARPGDKLYYYIQIYSPARFSDQVFVRWLFKDPNRGWQKTDRIPLQITGGRHEGFRALAIKSNYQPGEWRAQVETAMGHEIGRMSFDITSDDSLDVRNFEIIEK
ncbi:MAG: DUF2914 domain-containing protein [Bdellovibrionaceae bacterium]|nr:DUF2914 domain-containing protein [Pseudobdellovibrionaceae bacterium]